MTWPKVKIEIQDKMLWLKAKSQSFSSLAGNTVWDPRLFTHLVYLITEGNDASKKNNSNHKIAEAMETDENGEESEERKTAIRICKTSKHNEIAYNW